MKYRQDFLDIQYILSAPTIARRFVISLREVK